MKALTCAVFLFITSVAFADDFTIDLTSGWDRETSVMTDYVSRGISQTHGLPSTSTTMFYTFTNGSYLGGQAIYSQVGNQNIQADLVGGWDIAINKKLSYEVGFDYQNYPFSKLHAANSLEFQHIINYNLNERTTFIAAATFQPQAAQHAGFQTYSSVGLDFTVSSDITVGGRIGYLTTQVHRVQQNYADWTLTISCDMGHGISLLGQYTGLSEHCADCGNRFVAIIDYSF